MSFSFRNTLSIFTPSEAERITGVSVVLQRDWRRRGIIPKHDGHARFDLHDLADMLTLRALSDAGLSLDAAKAWIPFVPAGIIMHALRSPGAIEGDFGEFAYFHPNSWAMNIAASRSNMIAEGDLIIWPDGKSEIVPSSCGAISSAAPEKLYGVVSVLILEEIGREFARRAARPLVHIEKRVDQA